MTTNKGFKRLVRARMRATGETYTAARAAMTTRPASDAFRPASDAFRPASDAFRPASDAFRPSSEVERARHDQQRIVARMFSGGRLRVIPAKRKRRAAVLLEVLTRFQPGRRYREAEVSALLAEVHDDFAYLRRELVSFGYLHRSAGDYWICPEPPIRSARQRDELPAWEAAWLPGFVTGSPTSEVA